MAVGRIANHPHVDPITTSNVVRNCGRRSAEERLGSSPAVGIVDIRVGRVRRIAVLVDEIPSAFWSKVKDLGSGSIASADWRLVQIAERSRVGLREIGKVEVYEVVPCRFCRTSKDVVFAVVVNDRWVFDTSKGIGIGLWSNDYGTGTPFEAARQSSRD